MQHSSSDMIQKMNPATAMANKTSHPNTYRGWTVGDCRKAWNKPDNSKRKTLRTHRIGK